MRSKYIKFGYIGIFSMLLSIFCGAYNWSDGWEAYAEQGGLSIDNVHLDNIAIKPDEQTNISFFLAKDANVSVFVYNPDFAAIRTLMDNQSRRAGTIAVAWDGTDDSGRMVPDEAYLIGIVAEESDGRRTVYDPTAHSGGEILNLKLDKIEVSGGVYDIYYSLPEAARVSLKAGIRQGPLLKTIVDWEPHPPGDYRMIWDGMDDAGRIRVMDVPGALLDIRGFSLPEGTIIVQGSGGDYSAYHRGLSPAGTSGDVASQRLPAGISGDDSPERLPAQTSESISYTRFRQNVLKRSGESISQQYLVRRVLNVSPHFKVYLEDDRSSPLADRSSINVSGKAGIVIEVEGESLMSFNESRFEIIVFIDHRRFDEEEQAYSPYTYVLDTNRLENGEHWVTINLAGMKGQVSSYSFKLNVNN